MRAISVFSYAIFWPVIWPISIYWFLHILKLSLLPYPNTQSPDVIAYLCFDYTTSQLSLWTSLAVYNQVKKLNTGECAHVLGQKKCSSQRVGVLQIVFWLSGKYLQDLIRFVNRTRKFQNILILCLNLFQPNFVFTFIRGKFHMYVIESKTNLK